MTAFSLFLQESKQVIRDEMAAQGLKHTAFLSEAAKKWNSVGPEIKQKYVEMAQRQKDAYHQQVAALQKADNDEDGGGAHGDEEDGDNQRSKIFFSERCLPLLFLFREVHAVAYK